MNFKGNAIIYRFHRVWVENNDFSDFLSRFPPDHLPEGKALRAYLNSFVFCVDGYGSDRRELFAIPEVRRFYRAFYTAWPLWWFCCNLDVPNLLAMTLCCLDTLTLVQDNRSSAVQFRYSQSELRQLMEQAQPQTCQAFLRAGLTLEQHQLRTARLFAYFTSDWQP